MELLTDVTEAVSVMKTLREANYRITLIQHVHFIKVSG